jgi:hypothetical protein
MSFFVDLHFGLDGLNYTFTTPLYGSEAAMRIPFTLKDFEATEKRLLELGFQSDLPLPARQVFLFRRDYVDYQQIHRWTFRRKEGRVDICLINGLRDSVRHPTYSPLAPTVTPTREPPLETTITVRLPASLLEALKNRARHEDEPYQVWLRRKLRETLTSSPCCCRS